MPVALLSLQRTLLNHDHLLSDDGQSFACEITADGLVWLEDSASKETLHCADATREARLLLTLASPGICRPARLGTTASPYKLTQAQLAEEQLEAPSLAAPWPAERGERMVQHMNEDHADAVHHYFLLKGMAVTEARLLSVDPFGMWLASGDRTLRFPFDAPALDPVAVREALVALAHRSLPA